MVAKPRWLFIFTDAKYAQSIADGDHHVFTYTQVYNGIRAIEIPFCKHRVIAFLQPKRLARKLFMSGKHISLFLILCHSSYTFCRKVI